MARNAEIFFEHDSWPKALGWSAGFHVAVTAFIFLYATYLAGSPGQGWGSGGGGSAIGVTLVSSVPLPATPAPTQNVLANESKGLTQSQPKPQEKEPDAIEIQGKNTKVRPKKIVTVTKEKPKPEPEAGKQPGCLRPRRTGEWSLWILLRGRREGRIRHHRKWRRFRHEVWLVRADHSAESLRELAEVRSRSSNHKCAEGLHHVRCSARRASL